MNHHNRVRSFTLSASMAPGFTLGQALDSLNAVAAQVLPAGSTVELAGESREFSESGSALYFAFALALIFVFMVLAAQFESLLHPFTVLLAVPLAVTGALLGLWVTRSTLNVYSQIAMILLIGLVTKNSILLVTFANDLRLKGHDALTAMAKRTNSLRHSNERSPSSELYRSRSGSAPAPAAAARSATQSSVGCHCRRSSHSFWCRLCSWCSSAFVSGGDQPSLPRCPPTVHSLATTGHPQPARLYPWRRSEANHIIVGGGCHRHGGRHRVPVGGWVMASTTARLSYLSPRHDVAPLPWIPILLPRAVGSRQPPGSVEPRSQT